VTVQWAFREKRRFLLLKSLQAADQRFAKFPLSVWQEFAGCVDGNDTLGWEQLPGDGASTVKETDGME